jgi:hypothetical protein
LSWTLYELRLLREHYPTKGAARTAFILGRSYKAIVGQAHRMALTMEPEARSESHRAATAAIS